MNARRRLLETTCATCGNAIPDADHFDRDNAENVTGAAVCHCHARQRERSGGSR